ncbi:MAG: hypothetical protein IT289_00845 [Oligoflexia bacterium]|nr:hypothetical protein [Oligoflexia bacterium]
MPVDFTALLKDWGLTIGGIAAASGVLFFVFLMGLRVFLLWYLKLTKLSNQIEKLQSQIKSLENSVLEKNQTVEASPSEKEQFVFQKAFSGSKTSKEPTAFS